VATVGWQTNHDAAIAQSMPATTTNSTRDTIALAKHLNRIGAKVYVAYWCPYCHRQLNRFGKQAVSSLNVIECDRRAANNQNRLCVAKGIGGFPTWEINGRLYSGMRTLDDLARLSNYRNAN
jgi:glutaredoxin